MVMQHYPNLNRYSVLQLPSLFGRGEIKWAINKHAVVEEVKPLTIGNQLLLFGVEMALVCWFDEVVGAFSSGEGGRVS